MISSVTAGSYAGVRPAAAPATTTLNSQLSLLTSGDWDVISAAAGKSLNANNYMPANASPTAAPVLPLVAFTIANDRQSGVIPEGSALTAAYFQRMEDPSQPAEWNTQMAKAIAYINNLRTADTSTQLAADTSSLNLLA